MVVPLSALANQGCGIWEGNASARFSVWEGKSHMTLVGAGISGEGTGSCLGKVSSWYFKPQMNCCFLETPAFL